MIPRLLTVDNVAAAERLSTIAGWNQTPEDWRHLFQISPFSCWGLEAQGTLIATATGVRREDGLVWIGMVLTHPEFRGQGCATRLMQHLMDDEESRGAARFGLDATAMGKPVYEKLGFVGTSEVERWRRPARPAPAGDFPAGDRLRIGESWAAARPGRTAAFFGPCMASNPEDARKLVEWFLAQHGEEACLWDLDPKHEYAADLAAAQGFEAVRWLVRMYRGPADAPDPRAVAFPGFEYPPCV